MDEPAPTDSWVTRRRRLASIGGGGSGGGDRYPERRVATVPWRQVARPPKGPPGRARVPSGGRVCVKPIRCAQAPRCVRARCLPRPRPAVARPTGLLRSGRSRAAPARAGASDEVAATRRVVGTDALLRDGVHEDPLAALPWMHDRRPKAVDHRMPSAPQRRAGLASTTTVTRARAARHPLRRGGGIAARGLDGVSWYLAR